MSDEEAKMSRSSGAVLLMSQGRQRNKAETLSPLGVEQVVGRDHEEGVFPKGNNI